MIQQGEVSASEFIDMYELNFNIGNILKYVVQAWRMYGEDTVTALLKAKRY